MDRLEKIIYSVKYLPQVLYFGSLLIGAYLIYSDFYLGKEHNDLFITIFFFWFLYITYLAMKNLKTNKEFGGKTKKNDMMKKLKLVKRLSKLNILVGLGLLVLGVVYLNDGDNLGWLFISLTIATSANDIVKVFNKN